MRLKHFCLPLTSVDRKRNGGDILRSHTKLCVSGMDYGGGLVENKVVFEQGGPRFKSWFLQVGKVKGDVDLSGSFFPVGCQDETDVQMYNAYIGPEVGGSSCPNYVLV